MTDFLFLIVILIVILIVPALPRLRLRLRLGARKLSLLLLPAALCGVVAAPQFSSGAAATNEEQQLIRVLQSDHSPREKDAACARLKRIGTDASVRTLSALLTDEQLSHSARYALEIMPSPKAGGARVVRP